MFCTCVCAQCTLLYKSLQGLTEVLSYFNALKERLNKSQNIFLTEYLSLRHRSVPTDSVLGFLSRRSSASSADSADVELVSQHDSYTDSSSQGCCLHFRTNGLVPNTFKMGKKGSWKIVNIFEFTNFLATTWFLCKTTKKQAHNYSSIFCNKIYSVYST